MILLSLCRGSTHKHTHFIHQRRRTRLLSTNIKKKKKKKARRTLTMWTVLAALIWIFNIPTVSCLLHMEAPVGGNVLLSCVYKDFGSAPQNVSFLWWDKQKKVLLVIDHSVPEVRLQHQIFRGRVLTFPGLYRKGNFSIVLQDVQEEDSNDYACIIPQLNVQQDTRLSVSGESRVRASSLHLTALCLSLLLWWKLD
ncbi:uncharacterized protein LOC111235558 isoform X2 [Seriola dumerili]|uniref:uncharacterized protein LOC111235558 isoform X2 n=1 Tax=Seriola dumerili TaxID=41447 RepID=UPI000BBECA26|nr:uncharacterized protein LOC111235558 isoform X2 [Seriola dumerili]